ncbi:hypothetical protein ACOMHN_003480 [Nucella lapillus]
MRLVVESCVAAIVVCLLVGLEPVKAGSGAHHHDHDHHHRMRKNKKRDRDHHSNPGQGIGNKLKTSPNQLEIHTVKIGWLNVPKVVGCRCRHDGAICIRGPDGKPTCVQKHHLKESARLFKHYHELKERAEEDLNQVDPPPHHNLHNADSHIAHHTLHQAPHGVASLGAPHGVASLGAPHSVASLGAPHGVASPDGVASLGAPHGVASLGAPHGLHVSVVRPHQTGGGRPHPHQQQPAVLPDSKGSPHGRRNQHSHKRKEHHMANSASPDTQKLRCDNATLDEMRRRLIGWFHLLHGNRQHHHHGDGQRHRAHRHLSVKKELREDGAGGQCSCLRSVMWEFRQLDEDHSRTLSKGEVKVIDNNDLEPCLHPYLLTCDTDRDRQLSSQEWCCCFPQRESESPCYAKLDELEVSKDTETYTPSCDGEGYYHREQCKGGPSTQTCWCVTPSGAKISGSRTVGRAHCRDTVSITTLWGHSVHYHIRGQCPLPHQGHSVHYHIRGHSVHYHIRGHSVHYHIVGTVSITTSGDTVSITTSGDTVSITTSGDTVSITTSGDTVSITTSGETVSITTSGDTVSITTLMWCSSAHYPHPLPMWSTAGVAVPTTPTPPDVVHCRCSSAHYPHPLPMWSTAGVAVPTTPTPSRCGPRQV